MVIFRVENRLRTTRIDTKVFGFNRIMARFLSPVINDLRILSILYNRSIFGHAPKKKNIFAAKRSSKAINLTSGFSVWQRLALTQDQIASSTNFIDS